ncbi:hypothetical protein MMC18_004732 [Xylographa bjoerkii]|nr:hypothetical protein [Xylographa bjoerkii]
MVRTGGVSIFGLQFAKAAGAKVIATTSSLEKVEKLKKLGADHVIDYKKDEKWGETAKSLNPNQEGVHPSPRSRRICNHRAVFQGTYFRW